mmetsp:Transcript_67619/g.170647  ORF Transcript_67619/g.170647 Transcript_67619/m.170647 type:complete len:399 (-) Transcript_67619:49-1245(-)
MLLRIASSDFADPCAGLASPDASLEALLSVPSAEATAASACFPVHIAQMPEEKVVVGVAVIQLDILMTAAACTCMALEVQALAALLLPDHEDFRRQDSTVFVDSLESAQIPSKWTATLQSVFHLLEVAHVTVPVVAFSFLPPCEVWEVIQLGCEVAIPSIDGPRPVLQGVANMFVSGAGFRGASAPHVRHLCVGSRDDLAAANPHPHTLIDIFTSPTQHLVVKASSLIPPPLRHSSQPSRQHAHIHVLRPAPLKVAVPSHVALGHATTATNLRPRLDVQRRDLRHNHSPIVLTDELQKVPVPILLGSDVTIHKCQDVPCGCIAPSLLSSDKSNGALVSADFHLVLALHIRVQMRLGEWGRAPIINHNDLVKHIRRRHIKERLDRLERKITLLRAWQHH